MKKHQTRILRNYKSRWLISHFMETILFAASISIIGAAVTIFIDPDYILPVVLILLFTTSVIYFPLKGFRRINETNILRLLNMQYPEMEQSAELILRKEDELSLLAMLQKHRVQEKLLNQSLPLVFPGKLKIHATFIILALVILAGSWITPKNISSNTPLPVTKEREAIIPAESSPSISLKGLEVKIKPPGYTGLKEIIQSEGDIRIIEGSKVEWSLLFSGDPAQVTLNFSNGQELELYESESDGALHAAITANEQGIYDISYSDASGRRLRTDFYKFEIIKDGRPQIDLEGIEQYQELEFGQQQDISFRCNLSDDFGLTGAWIIATISKGSGESVKFREDKLLFESRIKSGSREAQLNKNLNFDELKMTPGDELYFYVEAYDNKQPVPNGARTEIYFISIKDTIEYVFSLEGNLGVDLMPEYFRSQRQIIIDTEKLISEKEKLTEYEFNLRSNELGFDQKALRLKYGQFLGVEEESGIAIVDEEELEESVSVEEGGEEKDPLDAFTDDHDSQNEELDDEGEPIADPLESFTHAHDAREIATFFSNTIRGKLRAALALMWDAELYLRLYEPQKSLPYQYKALELIKEIKNHARIYVHRIGFDPPPIKEESRLTGDLEDVNSQYDQQRLEKKISYPGIRRAIHKIDRNLEDNTLFEEEDDETFIKAGNELAILVIENPGKYINALQLLKQLSNNEQLSSKDLNILSQQLHAILPEYETIPTRGYRTNSELQQLYYKALKSKPQSR